MSHFRYLNKYVGTYRVKAFYDLDTNDFPRDDYGNIDKDFEDFYIPCKRGMIKHAYKDILYWYTDKIGAGNNVEKEIKAKYPKIIIEVYKTSSDVMLYFNSKDIEKISEIVIPSTWGCNMYPFNKSNLPKAKYPIPDKDMELYKDAVKCVPFEKIVLIAKLFAKFDNEIQKKMNKKNKQSSYNVTYEKRKSKLKNREFIHSIGMWEEFIEFINKELEKEKL